MKAIIVSNADTLRELRVFGGLLHELPPALCTNLTVFELWGPKRLPDLDPILPNAQGLLSLALVELTCRDIFPVLGNNADSFPQLTAFKLMSLDAYHSDVDIGRLTAFLSTKTQLRRLDTDLPGCQRTGVMELLDCIAQMENLEALGVDLRTLTDEEDLEIISTYLPDSLAAIHLQTCWENLLLESDEMAPLVSFRSHGIGQHPRVGSRNRPDRATSEHARA